MDLQGGEVTTTAATHEAAHTIFSILGARTVVKVTIDPLTAKAWRFTGNNLHRRSRDAPRICVSRAEGEPEDRQALRRWNAEMAFNTGVELLAPACLNANPEIALKTDCSGDFMWWTNVMLPRLDGKDMGLRGKVRRWTDAILVVAGHVITLPPVRNAIILASEEIEGMARKGATEINGDFFHYYFGHLRKERFIENAKRQIGWEAA